MTTNTKPRKAKRRGPGAPGDSAVWINGISSRLEAESKRAGMTRTEVTELALTRLFDDKNWTAYATARSNLFA